MRTGLKLHLRRSLSVAAVCFMGVALTACTGRGGGQLPPADALTGPASFGFTFSCQDAGGVNPPTGQLRIQLSYTEHGNNPIGSPFSIHGTADTIDPVLESQICIGQNPPPGGNELIFLGRYRLTSSAPGRFPRRARRARPRPRRRAGSRSSSGTTTRTAPRRRATTSRSRCRAGRPSPASSTPRPCSTPARASSRAATSPSTSAS